MIHSLSACPACDAGAPPADGYVELRDRATGERTELPVEELVDRLCEKANVV